MTKRVGFFSGRHAAGRDGRVRLGLTLGNAGGDVGGSHGILISFRSTARQSEPKRISLYSTTIGSRGYPLFGLSRSQERFRIRRIEWPGRERQRLALPRRRHRGRIRRASRPPAGSRGRPSASPSSTAATTTSSSRCSTRSRRPASRPATSRTRSARSCATRPTPTSCSPRSSSIDTGAPRGRARRRRALLRLPDPRRRSAATPTSATTSGRRARPGSRRLEDALEIRRRILLAFEKAEREADPARAPGAPDLRHRRRRADGRRARGRDRRDLAPRPRRTTSAHIDPREARIVLVEAGPRILAALLREELGARRADALRARGVEVRTGTPVTGVDADGRRARRASASRAQTVALGRGRRRLAARAVASACPLDRSRPRRRRAGPLDPRAPRGLRDRRPRRSSRTRRGQPASRASPPSPCSRAAARRAHILARARGQAAPPVPLPRQGHAGRHRAGRGRRRDRRPAALRASLAWLVWCFVHIFYLIGFRNRFIVMFEWAWAYVSYQRGARLITGDIEHPSAR